MSKIKVLPENLANKIAAGEVVERPASVVKELVENAIDAGSRRILVSLSEGGIRSIEVQDDGEGMAHDDARLAFQRHATSKLIDEDDLSSILTLGFRGEALPSIASISNVRLVTQTAGAAEGIEIILEGGVFLRERGIGAPRGAFIEVSDLFYNTPARRKFLKSPQTELAHASDIIFQLALSHPLIHFRLSHDKKVLIDAPPVQHLRDRILQLLGEPLHGELMEAHHDLAGGELSLALFFSRPPLRKNRRKEQYLFINQRPVKSPLLSHAVYDAYGNYLMKGEHPSFVLFLSVDPAQVDVNVHPTKREVRFQKAEPVHRAIRDAIRRALSLEGTGSSFADPASAGPSPSTGVFSSPGADRWAKPEGKDWAGWPEKAAEEKTLYRSEQALAEAGSHTGSLFPSFAPFIRPLGQVYDTFLLAEIDGEFTVIDQHTAHERILFERILEQKEKASLQIQPLLVPQQIDLPLQRAGLLKDYLSALERVGWKIEIFGGSAFLIREVPALVAKMNVEAFLLDLTEELAELGLASRQDDPFLKIVASMACHGAVRAGQSLSPDEIKSLLCDYFEKQTPATCPHGRPILLPYPLPELEKLFRRK